MNKATKLIAGIALLAIGYVGGAYLGFPSSDKEQMQGDMSKAAITEDPDMLAMQDILAEDAETQQNSIISTAFLSSHIDVLDSLANAGVKATKGQKPLTEICNYFTSLARKTANAKASLAKLMEVNKKVINGQKVDNFQEVSNNALLSFFVLDNAISNDAVDDMLEYTQQLDNEEVADVISGWMVYCSQNAEDTSNAKDIAMWKNVYAKLSAVQKQQFDASKSAIQNDLARNYTEELNESKTDCKNVKISGDQMPKAEKGANLINAMMTKSCNQGLIAAN